LAAATCRKSETVWTPRELCGGRSEKFERPKSLVFFEVSATRISKEVRRRNEAPRDNAAGTFKVNQPGGFHVNNRDTTAVLSPISGQAEETETSSQPAPAHKKKKKGRKEFRKIIKEKKKEGKMGD